MDSKDRHTHCLCLLGVGFHLDDLEWIFSHHNQNKNVNLLSGVLYCDSACWDKVRYKPSLTKNDRI